MGWLNIQLMQSSIVGLNNGEGKHHGYFETKSGTGRGLDIRGKCFDLLTMYITRFIICGSEIHGLIVLAVIFA